MKKKKTLLLGDLFKIPLDGNRFGLGIILYVAKHNFVIAIYDVMYYNDHSIDFDDLKNKPIVFFGYTLDAKFYHGDWTIIGNVGSLELSEIYFPYYKLGTPPKDIYVVNYKGEKLRKATLKEFEQLDYETTIAPIRYENALKAHFNLIEWKDDYNSILYSKVLNSVKLIDS
jgi:hypothetical protein